jgi:hypothetical protein
MATPCYLYMAKENKWVWYDESGSMKNWEDGWKRRPKFYSSEYYPWLERYPGRPTGLPDSKRKA